MKFEKLQAGMVLYDVKLASGRSRIFSKSKYDYWPVRIISVDKEKRTALISWNSNEPTICYEYNLIKFRKNPPKSKLD